VVADLTAQRMRWVARALGAAAELALPRVCGGCGGEGHSWCPACARRVQVESFDGGARVVRPSPCPVGLPPVWAAVPYTGAVQAALVAYKDSDRRDLAVVLAPLLGVALGRALADHPVLAATTASGNGPVLAVPVPSSPASRRRRGDAPLEELLDRTLRLGPWSAREVLPAPAGRFRRRVADQAGLDQRQRATNLEHAIEIRPRWHPALRGAVCILVDDVLTTGATLAETARAVRAAGAHPVAAVTVAATRRRGVPAAGGDVPARRPGQRAGAPGMVRTGRPSGSGDAFLRIP